VVGGGWLVGWARQCFSVRFLGVCFDGSLCYVSTTLPLVAVEHQVDVRSPISNKRCSGCILNGVSNGKEPVLLTFRWLFLVSLRLSPFAAFAFPTAMHANISQSINASLDRGRATTGTNRVAKPPAPSHTFKNRFEN
jgi:hypothetical protein